jgi:hypothetical protein
VSGRPPPLHLARSPIKSRPAKRFTPPSELRAAAIYLVSCCRRGGYASANPPRATLQPRVSASQPRAARLRPVPSLGSDSVRRHSPIPHGACCRLFSRLLLGASRGEKRQGGREVVDSTASMDLVRRDAAPEFVALDIRGEAESPEAKSDSVSHVVPA